MGAPQPKISKDFGMHDSQNPREMTLVAILLGLVLAVVMGAANVYLGLYAGMTVSASIPAAVISMGLLKVLQKTLNRKGNILENNIVQTMASTGESLAAGIIFTVPALIITKVWTGFSYWTVTFIAMTGGVLGVMFMIPIRKVLIAKDDTDLTYPEGVACAQVLKAGTEGASGIGLVFASLGIGALFKGLSHGYRIINPHYEKTFAAGNTGFYFGSDISPALLAVGFIVGLNVATLVFLGGAIGWIIGIPVLMAGNVPADGNVYDAAWTLWSTQVRYLGVGAMVIGGLWSIFSIRKGIVEGVKETLASFSAKARAAAEAKPRTEKDMGVKWIVGITTINVIIILALYTVLAKSFSLGILTTIIMIIAGFFFVAVSSYIVGLVGSSNNPVSGMTICTVLFASAIMLVFGFSGATGIIATLGIAGVVCCAACTAGDVSQDLKTGYIVGATPRSQQWAEIIGAVIPAFVMAPVLGLLHEAYGIGTGEPGSLAAPQASLFASITEAMFLKTKELPMDMILYGVIIGAILIGLNEWCKATGKKLRTHVMPVAIGIYLPLTLSVPIFIGGLIAYFVTRNIQNHEKKEAVKERGVLFSSGLIAGEALIGIALAIPIAEGVKLPIIGFENEYFTVACFAGLCFLLMQVAKSALKNKS